MEGADTRGEPGSTEWREEVRVESSGKTGFLSGHHKLTEGHVSAPWSSLSEIRVMCRPVPQKTLPSFSQLGGVNVIILGRSGKWGRDE